MTHFFLVVCLGPGKSGQSTMKLHPIPMAHRQDRVEKKKRKKERWREGWGGRNEGRNEERKQEKIQGSVAYSLWKEVRNLRSAWATK